jgi:hypothetical protein
MPGDASPILEAASTDGPRKLPCRAECFMPCDLLALNPLDSGVFEEAAKRGSESVGPVDTVAPPENVEDEVLKAAKEIAAPPAEAVAASRQLIDRSPAEIMKRTVEEAEIFRTSLTGGSRGVRAVSQRRVRCHSRRRSLLLSADWWRGRPFGRFREPPGLGWKKSGYSAHYQCSATLFRCCRLATSWRNSTC